LYGGMNHRRIKQVSQAQKTTIPLPQHLIDVAALPYLVLYLAEFGVYREALVVQVNLLMEVLPVIEVGLHPRPPFLVESAVTRGGRIAQGLRHLRGTHEGHMV